MAGWTVFTALKGIDSATDIIYPSAESLFEPEHEGPLPPPTELAK